MPHSKVHLTVEKLSNNGNPSLFPFPVYRLETIDLHRTDVVFDNSTNSLVVSKKDTHVVADYCIFANSHLLGTDDTRHIDKNIEIHPLVDDDGNMMYIGDLPLVIVYDMTNVISHP